MRLPLIALMSLSAMTSGCGSGVRLLYPQPTVPSPGARLIERQPYMTEPAVKPTYREAIAGWGQCAIEYNALNALHNGLVDWTELVETDGASESE